VAQAFKPASRSAEDTLYNGAAAGSTANKGIDMQGFDEALVTVQLGSVNNSLTSVTYTPQTKDANTNTAEDATTVLETDTTSSALVIGGTDDNKTKLIRIRCRDVGRFLFLKRVQVGAVAVDDAVTVSLTKGTDLPVTQDSNIDAAVSVSFDHNN
jgi:hypothetical protein